ncbi:hypothetical protein C8F01DRAFT_1231051 [Mycena amicta]|nr:hypothetical protein C8F01DRAFT_1231051 [Mycena amicta]
MNGNARISRATAVRSGSEDAAMTLSFEDDLVVHGSAPLGFGEGGQKLESPLVSDAARRSTERQYMGREGEGSLTLGRAIAVRWRRGSESGGRYVAAGGESHPGAIYLALFVALFTPRLVCFCFTQQNDQIVRGDFSSSTHLDCRIISRKFTWIGESPIGERRNVEVKGREGRLDAEYHGPDGPAEMRGRVARERDHGGYRFSSAWWLGGRRHVTSLTDG